MNDGKHTDENDFAVEGRSRDGCNSGAPVLNPGDEQSEFSNWLAGARGSDDVRNRIAVAGGAISRGKFGQCHLLVADDTIRVTRCSPEQVVINCQQQAANDSEYDLLPTTSRSHGS